MRTYIRLLFVPMAFAAIACSRDSRVDDALNMDLQLAAQARQFQPIDSVSALEQGYIKVPAPAAYRTASASAPRVIYRSAGSSASRAPAPRTRVEKHTMRDAAIGAATGAAIGAVTSRNKVKGAVIGAVAGGIVGGILGNNVDKTVKRE
jgi:hypothetical protein